MWSCMKLGIFGVFCFGMGLMWAMIFSLRQYSSSCVPDRGLHEVSSTVSTSQSKPLKIKAQNRIVNTELLHKVFENCTASRSTLFRTTIPMYYINLDKDADKRAYMEKTYGTAGKLTRVKAVNGKNLTELYEYGVVDELTANASACCDKMAAFSPPGVVALAFSHFKAIKTAYDNGDEYAITFEDDASDMYVPYWQCTLEEVVQRANEEIPDWAMIRLMYTPNAGNYRSVYGWFDRPKLLGNGASGGVYGAVAQILSRVGMKKVIDKYWDKTKQRWHCDRLCVADYILPTQLGTAVFSVQPPMFTVSLTEADRGIRSKTGPNAGDNRMFHVKSMLFGLQWNVEIHELRKMPGSQAVIETNWQPHSPQYLPW